MYKLLLTLKIYPHCERVRQIAAAFNIHGEGNSSLGEWGQHHTEVHLDISIPSMLFSNTFLALFLNDFPG
jgi:hypothetical protein